MVKATFEFLQWQDIYNTEKPYEIFVELPPELRDTQRTNLMFKGIDNIEVEDVRGRESQYSLDTNGFEYARHEMNPEIVKTNEQVKQKYLPKMEAWLKGHLDGADRVVFFDWRMRKSMPKAEFSKRTIDMNDQMDPLHPTPHPHNDQTPDGASQRVRHHLGEEAVGLLKGRYRIINIWRPLSRFSDWPLAVCDSRSVRDDDLLASDVVRRHYTGELYFALHNPDQRWHYMSDQEPHEVVLMKMYDSHPPGEGRHCVHSAFQLDDDVARTPRESIEIRAMVFTYPKG